MFGCERWRSNNKLVQGERDRIKKDEDLADRIAELESIRGAVLKAKFECAPQAGCAAALRLRELTQQTETLLGKTALTLVRKAALRVLLDQERMQNITELNQQGKTIYKQRV